MKKDTKTFCKEFKCRLNYKAKCKYYKQIGKDGRCINYTEHLYEKIGGKR